MAELDDKLKDWLKEKQNAKIASIPGLLDIIPNQDVKVTFSEMESVEKFQKCCKFWAGERTLNVSIVTQMDWGKINLTAVFDKPSE